MVLDTQVLIGLFIVSLVLVNVTFSGLLWKSTRRPVFKSLLILWSGGLVTLIVQAPFFTLREDLRVLAMGIVAPFSLLQAMLVAQVRGFRLPWKLFLALAPVGIILSRILHAAGVGGFWLAFLPSLIAASSLLYAGSRGLFGVGTEPVTMSSRALSLTAFVFGLHQLDFPVFYMVENAALPAQLVAAFLVVAESIFAPAAALELVARENARLKLLADYGGQLFNAAKMSALGTMAGGVAHELNNPLAALILRIELLRQDLEKTGDQKMLVAIASLEQIGRRMAQVVRSLLTFAEGERSPITADISATILVDSALDLCRERLRGLGIELRQGKVPNILVHCRAADASQIVVELINNAVDAVLPLDEKWIALDFESKPSGRFKLKVTDSGAGIPPEVAARIMEPFFTTKPLGKGSGLGLSVALGIAESNGGHLAYDLAAGHTRFVLDLPAGSPAP